MGIPPWQAHILEKRGTEELQVFTINKFIDEDILGIKLHSPNDRILIQPTFQWHYSM